MSDIRQELGRRVCVSVSARDTASALELASRAWERGAGLVEVRLDHFTEPQEADLAALAASEGKVILTCRRREEGGRWNVSEDERLGVLGAAIDARPTFVDIESSVSDGERQDLMEDAEGRGVGVVLSHHDLHRTPSQSDLHWQRILMLTDVPREPRSPHVVKIVTTAREMGDGLVTLWTCQQAHQSRVHADVGIVCFAAGPLGVLSRVLAPWYGADFTFACLAGFSTAPGQVTLTELLELYAEFAEWMGVATMELEEGDRK